MPQSSRLVARRRTTASSRSTPPQTDTERLEALWRGEFGDAYTERNAKAARGRLSFWRSVFRKFPCQRVLEVGCNRGANLQWIVRLLAPGAVFGLDVNHRALAHVREHLPGVNAVWGYARDLPFRDRYFDLVFTAGVLIHQSPAVLPLVMSEIVRCSRRYILAAEYYAEAPTEVPYRGQAGALYKRDFGSLYRQLFPDLRLRRDGFLPRGTGWDDVTYWLFEIPQ